MSTFVSVGNATQPFCRLLEAVARLTSVLPLPVVVQHGVAPFYAQDCRAVPFVGMEEFESLVVKAELLIMHAGAGSVMHALRSGKVPVVMPRRARYDEHVDDHQMEFAQALAETGRIVVAENQEQLADAVRRALSLQCGLNNLVKPPSAIVRLVNETLAGYASCLPKKNDARRLFCR